MKLGLLTIGSLLLVSGSLSAASYYCDTCGQRGYNYGYNDGGYYNQPYYQDDYYSGYDYPRDFYYRDGMRPYYDRGRFYRGNFYRGGRWDGRRDGMYFRGGRYPARYGQADNQHLDSQEIGMLDEPTATSSRDDREILNQIKNSIDGPHPDMRYIDLSVKVTNSNVLLSGTINTEEDLQEIKDRIMAIEGVHHIIDRVQLRKDAISDSYGEITARRGSARPSEVDRQLNLKAQDALKGGIFSKSYENVSVDIRNGHATINGEVEKESDRKEVVKRIQDLDGIRGVDDHLVVKEQK